MVLEGIPSVSGSLKVDLRRVAWLCGGELKCWRLRRHIKNIHMYKEQALSGELLLSIDIQTQTWHPGLRVAYIVIPHIAQ